MRCESRDSCEIEQRMSRTRIAVVGIIRRNRFRITFDHHCQIGMLTNLESKMVTTIYQDEQKKG